MKTTTTHRPVKRADRGKFAKGSGRPPGSGRHKGSKNLVSKSMKVALRELMETWGERWLLGLQMGAMAKPPYSAPYLKMMGEWGIGKPGPAEPARTGRGLVIVLSSQEDPLKDRSRPTRRSISRCRGRWSTPSRPFRHVPVRERSRRLRLGPRRRCRPGRPSPRPLLSSRRAMASVPARQSRACRSSCRTRTARTWSKCTSRATSSRIPTRRRGAIRGRIHGRELFAAFVQHPRRPLNGVRHARDPVAPAPWVDRNAKAMVDSALRRKIDRVMKDSRTRERSAS